MPVIIWSDDKRGVTGGMTREWRHGQAEDLILYFAPARRVTGGHWRSTPEKDAAQVPAHRTAAIARSWQFFTSGLLTVLSRQRSLWSTEPVPPPRTPRLPLLLLCHSSIRGKRDEHPCLNHPRAPCTVPAQSGHANGGQCCQSCQSVLGRRKSQIRRKKSHKIGHLFLDSE